MIALTLPLVNKVIFNFFTEILHLWSSISQNSNGIELFIDLNNSFSFKYLPHRVNKTNNECMGLFMYYAIYVENVYQVR